MKQKHNKHSEMRFTSYLDKDEYLIWAGEPQDNHFIRTRFVQFSCLNALITSAMLILSIISFFVSALFAPSFFIFPLFLLPLSFLTIFRLGKSYYAISNKRLFILEHVLFNFLHTEALSHLQKVSIREDEYNSFSLNFEPLELVNKRKHGIKQDYSIIFAAKHIEGLSQEDARTACELLIAEWEERAEELDWVE